MSKKSEEVLLIVNHVKNKKVDGILYMMGERMAWMQANKQSFSYSHAYTDIKGKIDFPNRPVLLLISCTSLLKIYCRGKRGIARNKQFLLLPELSSIFIKFEIVVFQFLRVSTLIVLERIEYF